MNYTDLFNALYAHPPTGWDVFRHPGQGVYFWPKNLTLMEDSCNDSLLPNHSILFEFHVTTEAGSARILARARFHGAEPEDDLRWKTWHDIAVHHCHADKVKEVDNAKETRSVAKWPFKNKIKKNTPVDEVANLVRIFLQKPPNTLTCFIGHLG
jgi:hypothetical protein